MKKLSLNINDVTYEFRQPKMSEFDIFEFIAVCSVCGDLQSKFMEAKCLSDAVSMAKSLNEAANHNWSMVREIMLKTVLNHTAAELEESLDYLNASDALRLSLDYSNAISGKKDGSEGN